MIGYKIKRPSDYDDDAIKLWFYLLDRGIHRRKDEEARWERNEKFENLRQWDGEEGQGDQVAINKVAAWVNTRLAAIAYKNPRAIVKPVNADGYRPITFSTGEMDPETGQPAIKQVYAHQVAEDTLNFVLSQPAMGLSATVRRFVKAGLMGYGVLKVGYTADFEANKPEHEQMIPVDPETGQLDFSGFELDEEGQPVEDENGNYVEKGSGLVSEQWFIDWVHYRNMIIDPDGGNDFRNHDWVAYEYIRPLKKVKEDPHLKNTKDLEATGDLEEPDKPNVEIKDIENIDPYVKDHTEQVRLFEIWDFHKRRVIVLADGYGKFLRNDPIPKGVDHSPYVFFRPNEILGESGEFYQRPPVTDLVPINDEYNKARRQQLIAMRRSNRKFIRTPDSFDTEELEKLTSEEDSVIAKTRLGSIDAAIQPLPMPSMDSSIYANVNQIALDFDEVGGQSSEARGLARADLATQVDAMEKHGTLREDDQRQSLAQALQMAFKKALDSLQANMTLEMSVSINGEDGQAFQAQVDRNMLLGDYDVSVDVTEMEPRNSQAEQARYLQLMQIFGQSPFLGADPDLAAAIFERFRERDQRVIDGMVRAAKMQMMLLMAPKQPEKDSKQATGSEAQRESQDRGARK